MYYKVIKEFYDLNGKHLKVGDLVAFPSCSDYDVLPINVYLISHELLATLLENYLYVEKYSEYKSVIF